MKIEGDFDQLAFSYVEREIPFGSDVIDDCIDIAYVVFSDEADLLHFKLAFDIQCNVVKIWPNNLVFTIYGDCR